MTAFLEGRLWAICFGLGILALAIQRPVAGDPPIGDCALKQVTQTLGPGYCNFEPQDCDYYVCTYVATCEGACTIGKTCQATETQRKLVYDYMDCHGGCPGNCVTDTHNERYGDEPSECGCAVEAF